MPLAAGLSQALALHCPVPCIDAVLQSSLNAIPEHMFCLFLQTQAHTPAACRLRLPRTHVLMMPAKHMPIPLLRAGLGCQEHMF